MFAKLRGDAGRQIGSDRDVSQVDEIVDELCGLVLREFTAATRSAAAANAPRTAHGLGVDREQHGASNCAELLSTGGQPHSLYTFLLVRTQSQVSGGVDRPLTQIA